MIDINNIFQDRTGESGYNNSGNYMKIIKYNNAMNVIVQYNDGYQTKCTYNDFKRGKVFYPFNKSVYGVGFFGDGKAKSSNKSYFIWFDTLKRCYDVKYLKKYPSYKGCTVCEEWHNYQNFAKWYDENYYEIPNEKMQLDKDILVKGNKIYSPETCVFVPQRINYIVLGRNRKRGKYPIGVYLHSDKDKFCAQSHDINAKMIYLGRYITPEEAFKVYKQYKEDVIKQIAEKYKNFIPKILYNALYSYKIEITD